MGGGTMSDVKHEEGPAVDAVLASAPKVAYAQDALIWRPFALGSLPPENVVVLVRYREDRAEAKFKNVSRMGATVDKHRVYPALPVYSRAPYSSRVERMFRGLVVLEPRFEGAADAARYMDGDVVDAFDAWMPCPS